MLELDGHMPVFLRLEHYLLRLFVVVVDSCEFQ
jgi:hypothetical protein